MVVVEDLIALRAQDWYPSTLCVLHACCELVARLHTLVAAPNNIDEIARMASQLTLDTKANPDMAEMLADCEIGVPYRITVTGVLSKHDGTMSVMDVDGIESKEALVDEDYEEEAPAPPPKSKRKSKAKVASAVSQVAEEMA